MGDTDPPAVFNYVEYLELLQKHNHNFFRLWRWELPKSTSKNWDKTVTTYCAPHPWERTGPGTAFDGKPKFDLMRFDEAYFKRLRMRVKAAGERGIYVSVMLCEGFGVQFYPADGHPFLGQNNIQGKEVEMSGEHKPLEIDTLNRPAITAIQEANLRKLIDTVNDLDNVLYEVCDEAGPYSTDWQYHVIQFVKSYEAGKAKQHPIGMTFQYQYGSNTTLFNSAADWISPNPRSAIGSYNYQDNPPPAEGRKVIVADTDHLWGVGGDVQWVWKSFLRGLNLLSMDPIDDSLTNRLPQNAEAVRRNMGYVRRYATRMDLVKMTPQAGLCSTGYCLANAGVEYLIYQPAESGAALSVELGAGSYEVEWFDPGTGKASLAPSQVATRGKTWLTRRRAARRCCIFGGALDSCPNTLQVGQRYTREHRYADAPAAFFSGAFSGAVGNWRIASKLPLEAGCRKPSQAVSGPRTYFFNLANASRICGLEGSSWAAASRCDSASAACPRRNDSLPSS